MVWGGLTDKCPLAEHDARMSIFAFNGNYKHIDQSSS